MRVNMMDIFCIQVWKEKNETYWNCSKKGRGGRGRTMEEGNLTKIYYCKHMDKYHNVIK
jgi:hypothetical protein